MEPLLCLSMSKLHISVSCVFIWNEARLNTSFMYKELVLKQVCPALSPSLFHSLNNGPVKAALQALLRMFGIKRCISNLLTFLHAHHWGTEKVQCQSHELFNQKFQHFQCVTFAITFPTQILTSPHQTRNNLLPSWAACMKLILNHTDLISTFNHLLMLILMWSLFLRPESQTLTYSCPLPWLVSYLSLGMTKTPDSNSLVSLTHETMKGCCAKFGCWNGKLFIKSLKSVFSRDHSYLLQML